MPLSCRTRILILWTAVLAGIALGSAAIITLNGTALVDQAPSGAPEIWRRIDARLAAVFRGGQF